MRAFSSIFTLWLSVACSPEPRGDAWSADGQPFDTLTLPSVQVAPPGGPITLAVSPILLGREAEGLGQAGPGLHRAAHHLQGVRHLREQGAGPLIGFALEDAVGDIHPDRDREDRRRADQEEQRC